jgi:hypothetical protein
MMRRFLGLTFGFVLAPLVASAAPVSAQRPAPPAPPPVVSAPVLSPRLTTPVLAPGLTTPLVLPRFNGTRPFFRRHHRHLFFFPVVAFTDGMTTCEEAALLVHDAAVSQVGGSRDFVVAYVDHPELATALLYGLRAAGYRDVQLVALQFDPASLYRAEFRLGRHDASLC